MTVELTTREVRLTQTELRVMKLVAQGHPYKAIADRLGCSVQTIKNHVANVRVKLGANCAIDAIGKLGWITVPDLGNLQPNRVMECGWLGTCGRPAFHRGHHGGFREHVPT